MSSNPSTTVTVDFDGRSATEQIKDLSKQAAKARIELKKAYEANDAGAVAKTEAELDKLNKRLA